MTRLRSITCFASLVCLGAANAAFGDGVTLINSAVVTTHVFNDVPSATPFVFNNYTSSGGGFILLGENGVSAPSGFADRDVWRFSADGSTPFVISPKYYFSASMQVTLTGSPTSPRKEAGWLFSTGSNGDIQFIVDSDAQEVVQFGGISFYSFTGNNIVPPYQNGTQITLGMKYFVDPNTGANAMQFSVNATNMSPIFDFGPSVGSGASDIGTGSLLGGYFQIQNDPNNLSNGGNVLFSDISIVPAPEPAVAALIGAGLLSLVLIRRRRLI